MVPIRQKIRIYIILRRTGKTFYENEDDAQRLVVRLVAAMRVLGD